ncbi:MAG: hypothetical protein J6Y37_17710 [Paludibacteraceae bacterium]|nr:hypothetical protein [Paludibacteraceae bacterium]
MEEKTINFKEVPVCYSQQTIVKILKEVKYHFEPIIDYENTQFVCVTEIKEDDIIKSVLKFFGFKVKDKYRKCTLALTICGNTPGQPIVEPMVFTRDDVERVLRDVPENYTGEKTL